MNKGRNNNVVILHGWKLDSKKYEPLSRKLEKKGYKVFIPDMPGNGIENTPKRVFCLDDYVIFVRKYLLSMKVQKCVLIGHSFGGRVAIKLTAKYPELVEKLVLTGVPGIVPVSTSRITIFLILAKIGNLIFSVPGVSLDKDYARRVLYRLAKSSDYYHTDGVMRQTFKNIIKTDLVESMRKLNVPVQLIWGMDDHIVPVNIAQKMNIIIETSRLNVIPDAGHDVIWIKPVEFMHRINNK